ncbi:hypothetical protein LCGC14_3026560 [marine sediment metagenome]|uniref:Uncharacterized protein n=1 Tax=marine sediment metagenome TaxID=412755 RepID=A0A0F8WU05_9ZZZZ
MGRRSDAAQHEQRHLLGDVYVNVELIGKKNVHEEDDCRCEEEEAHSVHHVIPPYTSIRMTATVQG